MKGKLRLEKERRDDRDEEKRLWEKRDMKDWKREKELRKDKVYSRSNKREIEREKYKRNIGNLFFFQSFSFFQFVSLFLSIFCSFNRSYFLSISPSTHSFLSIFLVFNLSIPFFLSFFQSFFLSFIQFLGATKHLYNWLCPSVGLSVCNAFVRRSTRRTLLAYLAFFWYMTMEFAPVCIWGR